MGPQAIVCPPRQSVGIAYKGYQDHRLRATRLNQVFCFVMNSNRLIG